ncbi:NHLP bacteriocin export ABC transporter permease/ATPase subunit [Xylophilus sp. Leaf220]|uniref:NHLP bacteriocin export ABC transporter permease/ATPase subunit n=1 Tax=Xylophilus sp. Leaf220 TaxID=1735686 RepID=UPI0007013565|nr:NHLP bacteriocin export ABC transporter permease/ATPase subunit [Xylophilus sp. Leaf220]KQM70237.1 hypothetical protein ASE76_10570 [Xylophilus sp. Leaf220]
MSLPFSDAAAPLTDFMVAHGAVRAVAGNTPFLLDRPDRAIAIVEGAVDLFMVQVEDGVPTGVREFMFTLGAGDLLLGVDGSEAMLPVGLLAVGQVGTRIAEAGMADLQAAAAHPDLQPWVVRGIDRWIEGLSDAMARPIVPRPPVAVLLSPGETLDAGPGQRIGARGVVWIDTQGATPLYLDSEDLPAAGEGALVPLSPAAWLMLHEAGTVTAHDTAAAVAGGACWRGLDALHAVLQDIVPLNLRLAAVDELNRVRSRAAADQQAARNAFVRLAEPLAALRGGRAVGTVDSDDPLVQAVAAAVAPLGHALKAPVRARDQDDVRSAFSLEDILKANRLRARRVLLRGRWWESDTGPFLLRRAEDDRPLAVVPRGLRRRYYLLDPVAGTNRLLTARDAEAVAGEAWSFSVPLPVRPLKSRDVGGNVLRWAPADVAALVGFGLAGGLLGMAVPIATGFLVDTVIPGYDLPKLWQMGVLLFIAALVTLLTRHAVQIASVRIEGRSGTRMQAAVMDRILRLPIGFFKDFTAGDLATRALAIRAIEQAISGSVISSLMSGVFALVSLGLMFFYSARLAVAALGLVLLLAAITGAIGYLRVRHERDVMKTSGATAGLLLQLATGIAKLRLAAAEDRAFLRWSTLYGSLTRQRLGAGGVSNASHLVQGVYATFSTAVIFGLIYWLGLAGAAGGAPASGSEAATTGLALGSLLAFLAAFGQAMGGMAELATVGVTLYALKPVFAYAAPILEATPEVDDAKADPGPLSGAIELSHLTFRYAPDVPPVFSDLSLDIRAGEYVAIVGPSGSGKSTLVRLMLGFEKAESGAILYDGRDLSGLDMQAVRRQFGVVLQNGRLMPGTLQENILGAHIHLAEADAWRVADQVGLGDDIRGMPMGMQTVITDAGGVLSGGQVQRILIARALVGSPRVLLFDEATSALDNRTQAMVTETLARLDSTRIVIAHRLSTVVNTDRIIVLKDGAVQESGSYAQLMAQRGIFHDLAQRQLV